MPHSRNSKFANSDQEEPTSMPPSRSPTPRVMEKTDSVVNLTRPALYAIYNQSSLLSFNKDESYEDLELTKDEPSSHQSKDMLGSRVRSSVAKESATESNTKSITYQVMNLIVKVMALSVAAFIYNGLTKHIHNNHIPSTNSFDPLQFTNLLLRNFFDKLRLENKHNYYSVNLLNKLLAPTLQGLLMGLIHPLLDSKLPTILSKRLLSSNPDPYYASQYSNLFNDLIRASITFLGISYAIRKLEWSSFLQISIVWSLLNPGLWLLLDGTISGFLSSFIIAMLACLGVYSLNYSLLNSYLGFQRHDFIAIWVWIASFFFCGLIIFGKIGRGLFGKYALI